MLVTGASGFLGRHLVRALLARGLEVHALSRRERVAREPNLHWRRVDLADAGEVARTVESLRPGLVFHLASRVSGRRDLELVLPTFRDNLASSVNLFTALAAAGCRRIVVAGSMEEPDLASGEPPASPYAVAKGAASLYARFFHALFELPVVQSRIFMVYGPGQQDHSKVIPYSIGEALAGRAPGLTSGARRVDWIYVEDVVRGLLALADTRGLEGETLDLGSGELVTVREVVERICNALEAPAPRVGALPDRPLETTRRANVERTRERTGWQPFVGLDEGLHRTIVALRGERSDEPA